MINKIGNKESINSKTVIIPAVMALVMSVQTQVANAFDIKFNIHPIQTHVINKHHHGNHHKGKHRTKIVYSIKCNKNLKCRKVKEKVKVRYSTRYNNSYSNHSHNYNHKKYDRHDSYNERYNHRQNEFNSRYNNNYTSDSYDLDDTYYEDGKLYVK